MGVLALFVALGLFYRLSALLLCLAFTYVFLLDKAYYLNHFYLIALLSFLLCLIPAHHAASLDRWLFFRSQPPFVPQWSVFILRAQMSIVYFYAGLAKLNPDWLRGEPMRMWLAERTDFPIMGVYFTSEWVALGFAYGGLLFDLSIGFLLMWGRTRPFAFILAGMFHLLNSQFFQIGIFPLLAFGATLIFAAPDWPRRLSAGPGRLWKRSPAKASAPTSAPAEIPVTSRWSTATVIFIHLYLLAQLLVPLRHWLYPGDVNWTEEGHRFSWHMKLRDKEAVLHLYLVDPRTGQVWEISPAVDLSARQLDEMKTRPDMVLQYAHYLADKLSAGGRPRPIIRADLKVSLNGRPYQSLINPNVNLAEVSLGLQAADWILPLTTPLPIQTTTLLGD
jgi:hypothetical protein